MLDICFGVIRLTFDVATLDPGYLWLSFPWRKSPDDDASCLWNELGYGTSVIIKVSHFSLSSKVQRI